MVNIIIPQEMNGSLAVSELIFPGEEVAVIDDSPEMIVLLSHYLTDQGLKVVAAGSAQGLFRLMAAHRIALVLLDIELPDKNGNEVLRDLVASHPDLAIIMITGTTDIEMALDCLRQGADDYLPKPVSINQFHYTVLNTLKKRRLAISNRLYQQELQKTNARMRFLHHLNLKMNTAYLNTMELRGILQAILVGITSEEGLRFNRAFLALYNPDGSCLEGKLAIGPASREHAGQLWKEIREKGLQLEDLLATIQRKNGSEDVEVNRIIKGLRVSAEESDHVLIRASRLKRPILVRQGSAEACRVPEELIRSLGESAFAVIPLYSPEKALGVLIVDNFVTGAPISAEDIQDLEIFASQASLAIEHSRLYTAMADKINALELVTEELERNKDLLIELERTSAIGQMSAQLLHAIRNPLASIGGTSRLLTKKTNDPYLLDFLKIISESSSKIEVLLEDLFGFVEETKLSLAFQPLFPLIRKSVMLFYPAMKNGRIEYAMDLPGTGPVLMLDENRVRQIFLHLIRNSLEAMPQGGRLSITTVEEAQTITVAVTDTGLGIPTATLPHVKDPFFTTKTYGNGLGLALVDKYVQAHGGTFSIANSPAGGTVASVRLPKQSPPAG